MWMFARLQRAGKMSNLCIERPRLGLSYDQRRSRFHVANAALPDSTVNGSGARGIVGFTRYVIGSIGSETIIYELGRMVRGLQWEKPVA